MPLPKCPCGKLVMSLFPSRLPSSLRCFSGLLPCLMRDDMEGLPGDIGSHLRLRPDRGGRGVCGRGNGREQRSVGSLGPIQAQLAWIPESLESKVKCLVSIGTGVSSFKSFKDDVLHIGETLVAIATETEQTAERGLAREGAAGQHGAVLPAHGGAGAGQD
jgi:hypothetical protein